MNEQQVMSGKSIDRWEVVYLILYALLLVREFLDTTMFPIPWPDGMMRYLYVLIIVYVLAKMAFHRTYTKWEYLLAGLVIVAFSISAVVSGYLWLVGVGFLIVGAKDVKFDHILKVYLLIGLTIMVAAFVASQAGWIENLMFYSLDKGARYSFGIIYTTDFAAHVFFLLLAFVCINNRKPSVWSMVFALALAALVFFVTSAYTSFLGILLFFVAMIVLRFLDGRSVLLPQPLQYLTCVIPAVCAVGFLTCVHFYNPYNAWWWRLDSGIFNTRLWNSANAVEEYGYSLFGQFIPEIGNGGEFTYRTDYFFIDDSYIRIALEYGVVIFVVVLLLLGISLKRMMNANRMIMAIATLLIVVCSVMEHHLLELAYNPFLLCVFAGLCYNNTLRDFAGGDTCTER